MGGVAVSKKTTESQLAEDYNLHGVNADDWGEAEPLAQPVRREVTLSVRFSREEIAAIRAAAHMAGVKPTAFIRELAVTTATGSGAQTPKKALNEAIDILARDLDHLRRAARAA
jgi:hypothetical protein